MSWYNNAYENYFTHDGCPCQAARRNYMEFIDKQVEKEPQPTSILDSALKVTDAHADYEYEAIRVMSLMKHLNDKLEDGDTFKFINDIKNDYSYNLTDSAKFLLSIPMFDEATYRSWEDKIKRALEPLWAKRKTKKADKMASSIITEEFNKPEVKGFFNLIFSGVVVQIRDQYKNGDTTNSGTFIEEQESVDDGGEHVQQNELPYSFNDYFNYTFAGNGSIALANEDENSLTSLRRRPSMDIPHLLEPIRYYDVFSWSHFYAYVNEHKRDNFDVLDMVHRAEQFTYETDYMRMEPVRKMAAQSSYYSTLRYYSDYFWKLTDENKHLHKQAIELLMQVLGIQDKEEAERTVRRLYDFGHTATEIIGSCNLLMVPV